MASKQFTQQDDEDPQQRALDAVLSAGPVAKPGPGGFDKGLAGGNTGYAGGLIGQAAQSPGGVSGAIQGTQPFKAEGSPYAPVPISMDTAKRMNDYYAGADSRKTARDQELSTLRATQGGNANVSTPVSDAQNADYLAMQQVLGVGPQTAKPAGSIPGQSAAPAAWDTDGYAAPAYTAQNFGKAPLGWNQQKWEDPNNQDPKYVVGRLLVEAGGDKAAFAQKIAQAYPGAQFDGKDIVTGIPGLGPIDVYGGASVGRNTPQWIDENAAAAEGGGAGPAGAAASLSAPGAPAVGGGAGTDVTADSTYQKLLKALQAQGLDQQALSKVLG